ncbi:MAG TPA: aspartate-semialdehyde dehydrogenase [Candidatus Kapabacteria bacterium]|nr:aspartate-semialdehyde dehydrogenase [Candidatus Kapabacteria bacterium]
MAKTNIRLGVVGATGAVGTEMFRILEERNFPYSSLRAFASERSVGKTVHCNGKAIKVELLESRIFADLDIALFSAGSNITKQFRDDAKKAGCLIIDNSSAYRMDKDVPLVIPEINGEDCKWHHGLIAVPNCAAIVMLMAVHPIRQLAKIRRIVVSTYQAASGAGAKALAELESQTKDIVEGKVAVPNILPYQIAFNLFSHNTTINEAGYNGEEWKVIHESKKILHDESISITVTCIRVAVARAHSESVNIEFADKRPSIDKVRNILNHSPGVRLVDDRTNNYFPMPLEASGSDDVLVGRLRNDISNPNAIDLFVSGDQLRKGAALDAIQIAEYVLQNNLI